MNATSPQTPGSMLEIYMHAVSNHTSDDFLDTINMGVGNYTSGEYWQQINAFRNGLYANSAMTRTIIQQAIKQTQKRLVDAIWDKERFGRDAQILRSIDYPVPDIDENNITRHKQEYLEEHMEDIWENLGDLNDYSTHEHQAWLVHMCTNLDMDWTPPHWRMLKARHEASRSKDARLIDNLFGRPPDPSDMPNMGDF